MSDNRETKWMRGWHVHSISTCVGYVAVDKLCNLLEPQPLHL